MFQKLGEIMQSGKLTTLMTGKLTCSPCSWQQGPAGPPGPAGEPFYMGNVLRVDDVYGNDASGAAEPYLRPFKTITAAITKINGPPVLSGHTIWIFPGTYEGSVIVPPNSAIRGMNTQTVAIHKTTGFVNNITNTAVTMGLNSRLEDVIVRLDNTGSLVTGATMVGVLYPVGTSANAKFRTGVINVINISTSCQAYGVLSEGDVSGSTIVVSSNALRGTTVNTTSNSTTGSASIYVKGQNRFATRDVNIFAMGSATGYIAGGMVDTSGGFLELRGSTISGVNTGSGPGVDLSGNNVGQFYLGTSDLVNNHVDCSGFDVSIFPAYLQFNVIGNLVANTTYGLLPGTAIISELTATRFKFRLINSSIIFSTTARFSGSMGGGVIVTLNIYKNDDIVLSVVLNSANTSVIKKDVAVSYLVTDDISASLVTTGNPGDGTFTSICYLY